MKTPFSNDDSRKEDIRQEDLLDLVEELEKQRCRLLVAMTDLETRRQKLLIDMTDNFVLWGRVLTKTRELIEEMKRRKWEKR